MIAPSDVTAWSAFAPWATPDQIEQDLDYVRTTSGGGGHLIDAVREVAEHVGFQDVRSRIGIHPKVVLRTTSSTGAALRVTVEMNTFERSPSRPTTTRRLEITSAWFTGAADVPTFALAELLATKIRALYQRAKGRDAFDLWLVAKAFDVDPNDIAECFEPYRPAGWSPVRARTNLSAKVRDGAYLEDLRPLVEADDAETRMGTAPGATPSPQQPEPTIPRRFVTVMAADRSCDPRRTCSTSLAPSSHRPIEATHRPSSTRPMTCVARNADGDAIESARAGHLDHENQVPIK